MPPAKRAFTFTANALTGAVTIGTDRSEVARRNLVGFIPITEHANQRVFVRAFRDLDMATRYAADVWNPEDARAERKIAQQQVRRYKRQHGIA